jgi:MarR family transcriptional regulator for hemolysin
MAREPPSPTSGRPAYLLSFLLNGVARLYARHFENRSPAAGLTLTQCEVITLLASNEGVSQTRFAKISGICPTTLVRIVDQMERDALIERHINDQDRRARYLRLGWAAQRALPEVTRLMELLCAELFTDIGETDQLHLLATLEQLRLNLTPADGKRRPELE